MSDDDGGPAGRRTAWAVAIVGMVGTVIAAVVGIVPQFMDDPKPSQTEHVIPSSSPALASTAAHLVGKACLPGGWVEDSYPYKTAVDGAGPVSVSLTGLVWGIRSDGTGSIRFNALSDIVTPVNGSSIRLRFGGTADFTWRVNRTGILAVSARTTLTLGDSGDTQTGVGTVDIYKDDKLVKSLTIAWPQSSSELEYACTDNHLTIGSHSLVRM